jgi:hypothetical protein
MRRSISIPLTTLFTVHCWVPFRQTSWNGTMSMFAALFGFGSGRAMWYPAVLAWSMALVIGGHFAGSLLARERAPRFLAAIGGERFVSAISGPQLVVGLRSVRGAFTVTAVILAIYFFGAFYEPVYLLPLLRTVRDIRARAARATARLESPVLRWAATAVRTAPAVHRPAGGADRRK